MTLADYPVAADAPEAAGPPPGRAKRRPPWLAVAVIAVVPVLVLVLYETLVTGFMYDQRQQHLAANFAQPRPKTADGQAYGVLQIPKLDLNEVVIEGDSTANLRSAPAHRPGRTQPGQAGTVVVLGHHSRFGGPFNDLAQLGAGDSIFLQAKNGPVTEYDVVCNLVVDSGRSPYLIPGTDSRLVLVTGSGGLFSGKRRVVVASTEPPPGSPSCPSPAGLEAAEAVPSLEPDRGSLIVNRDALLFYAALTVTIVVGRYLRRRYRPMAAAVALAPLVALTAVMALGLLDRILPGTL